MKITAFSISYLAVTHALAAIGKPRPPMQRSRLPNTLLTASDCATYVAMYRMMKKTGAPPALMALPAIGAAAHFVYVLLQIPDDWYREYADNYEEPTLMNGLLIKIKMPAAQIDAAFYGVGLAYLLARRPLSKTLLPVAAGALAGLAIWRPWAPEAPPATQDVAQAEASRAAASDLSERARRIVDALEAINLPVDEAIRRAAEIYDEDVLFSDPVQTCRGRAAVLDMIRRTRERARELHYEIDRGSVVESGDQLYFRWTGVMAGKIGPKVRVEGTSQLMLRDGRVVRYRDSFDLLSSVIGSLPAVSAIYRRLVRLVG